MSSGEMFLALFYIGALSALLGIWMVLERLANDFSKVVERFEDRERRHIRRMEELKEKMRNDWGMTEGADNEDND